MRLYSDPVTGLWRHRAGPVEPPLRLRELSYAGGSLDYPRHIARAGVEVLPTYLDEARAVFAAALTSPEDLDASVSPDFDALRWFALPAASLA